MIRQAKALTDRSKDTFWVPDDGGDRDGLCDLELLARQIYERHVDSYSLRTPAGDGAMPVPGGAEWWVQFKPAGVRKAPVDLHYDKDEVIAEKFGLGSFPTLSTVTYLTGAEDNSPTVVFPHAYDDEEDRPIGAMLLSRAKRAKYVVFDGRLLHGSPAHPSLLPRGHVDGRRDEKSNGDAEGGSSLRVTFLVNVWKSGRPAGVDVLPESVRAAVRSAASGTASVRGATPLEFRRRRVSEISVPANDEEKIVLPFVSSGATWIGDEAGTDAGSGEDGESAPEEIGREDRSGGASGKDDDKEEKDDD